MRKPRSFISIKTERSDDRLRPANIGTLQFVDLLPPLITIYDVGAALIFFQRFRLNRFAPVSNFQPARYRLCDFQLFATRRLSQSTEISREDAQFLHCIKACVGVARFGRPAWVPQFPQVEVDDTEIRIIGRRTVLERLHWQEFDYLLQTVISSMCPWDLLTASSKAKLPFRILQPCSNEGPYQPAGSSHVCERNRRR